MNDLISRKTLQREIENLYDLNYGERLIDPREFYDMVDNQKVAIKEKKIEKADDKAERYGGLLITIHEIIHAPAEDDGDYYDAIHQLINDWYDKEVKND